MTARSPLPELPPDKAVLFFDGVCVLCSGFARFVMKHDSHDGFRMAAAQSEIGQAAYRHYGLDPVVFTTNLLIWRGRAFTKSDAFIQTMRLLGFPCSLAAILLIVPAAWRDRLYDPIARNRYRWFGVRDVCYLPQDSERERFLS